MPADSPYETRVFGDLEAMSQALAAEIARAASDAVAARGRFTIALSGGNTPRRLYQLLAAEYREQVPWHAVHVFFGDERCVRPTHVESNYGMARFELLSRVPIPSDQVYRMAGELSPEDGARRYDALLRRLLADGDATSPSRGETLDVALQGVGADGHTASLFPGSWALEERERWAVAVEAPEYMETRMRITMTLPVLNGARDVYVQVAGAEKRHIAGEILGGDPTAASKYPAARLRGAGRTVWFLDRAARG
jgi:6-phosphogluconolactonase